MGVNSRQHWVMARAGGPRRGFSLIEVLAALMIFSVCIVGVLEGVASALSFQTDLAMRQRAAMLASNVLEEIRYGNDLAEGEDSGQFDGDDAVFTWSTAIEETDFPGLMQVTAKVSWGQQESPKEYTITTLMLDQSATAEERQPGLPGQRGGNSPNNMAMPPQPGGPQ